jgi:hypothetical protein
MLIMLWERTLRLVIIRLIRLILYARAVIDLNASCSSSGRNITYSSGVPFPPSFLLEGYSIRL